MAMKKGGLGRGLDAILLDTNASDDENVRVVRLSEIEPNASQPRKTFDPEELASLAESISEYGVIQPITVRRVGDMYEIIAGERRWRAARMAGLSEVPVVVISADDKKASEIALVENIQRKDLNPIEESEAFASLINEYGLTQEEVGRRVGRSRSAITNALRLLELPEEVRDMLVSGAISEGHAKVLLGIKDKTKIAIAAETVGAKNLSVRETEALVKQINNPKPEKTAKAPTDLDYTRELERAVASRIGRTVKIVQNGERSTINVGFTDNKDLETVLRLLCGDDFVDSL
ncbi:MAG: ParB/RepB/Spo0J family partition protein [Clostridiales bacterium]|nr:ParB/RepB/Spo0J family partition protein [Clostridiales bacterium]